MQLDSGTKTVNTVLTCSRNDFEALNCEVLNEFKQSQKSVKCEVGVAKRLNMQPDVYKYSIALYALLLSPSVHRKMTTVTKGTGSVCNKQRKMHKVPHIG